MANNEERKIIEVKASKKLMDALDEVHREEQSSGNEEDMDDPLVECARCRKPTRESDLDKMGECRSCGGG